MDIVSNEYATSSV